MSKICVAYFSATGTTERLAQKIAEITKGDLYPIQPQIPYTKKDLNWINPFSRSTKEMKGSLPHPKIIDQDLHLDDYSLIYLGFPIWWYKAPTIICSFLERYDLSHKKIILFATSGKSGFGKTVLELEKYVDASTQIREGKVISGTYSDEDLKQWLEEVKE